MYTYIFSNYIISQGVFYKIFLTFRQSDKNCRFFWGLLYTLSQHQFFLFYPIALQFPVISPFYPSPSSFSFYPFLLLFLSGFFSGRYFGKYISLVQGCCLYGREHRFTNQNISPNLTWELACHRLGRPKVQIMN